MLGWSAKIINCVGLRRPDNERWRNCLWKGSSKPPFPPEKPYITKEGTLKQRCDWKKLGREYEQRLKKLLRKNDSENGMDTTDAMMKRRSRVLVEYTQKIVERYQHVPGYELEHWDETGDTFINLNFLPANTYNYLEERVYLLAAASIWILDEILLPEDREKRIQLFRLLPRNENDLDEIWNSPEFWHTNYEDELIESVQFVLHCRNQDIEATEIEHDHTKRLLTSSLIARDAQHINVPSRQAYEKLISLIPKESIEQAAAYFEELFWLWTDRFFDCIAPLDAAIRQTTNIANKLAGIITGYDWN